MFSREENFLDCFVKTRMAEERSWMVREVLTPASTTSGAKN